MFMIYIKNSIIKIYFSIIKEIIFNFKMINYILKNWIFNSVHSVGVKFSISKLLFFIFSLEGNVVSLAC